MKSPDFFPLAKVTVKVSEGPVKLRLYVCICIDKYVTIYIISSRLLPFISAHTPQCTRMQSTGPAPTCWTA